jgi:ketosteroid isomerase-like protein
MKRIAVVAALALFCIALPLTLSAQTDIAAHVAHLEQVWADAQKAGDAARIAPLLADTFVNTDVDGAKSGKAELLAGLKGGKWEVNQISDVKVMAYGDTAIATGAWAGKGVEGDGTKVDRHERWTDTWVKMKDGKWQCVASQQTGTKN